MLAANVDFGILKLVAAAAVGVVLWWQQRKAKQADEELEKRVRENDRAAGGPTRSFPAPSAPPLETPEQEKLRRFLEALGVPAGQPPAPPPPVRPVAPPLDPASSPYRPAQVEPPRRPVVRPPAPRPVVAAPPVRRPVMMEAEPEPMESRDAGHLVESSRELVEAARYEAVPIPQVSVSVATPPAQNTRPPSDGLAALQRALRSGESLRTAFLLKEVLGAPKSMQETG